MTERPRIVGAGLGPGGDEHVTAETLRAIERIPRRYLRTSRHPSAHLVPDPITFDDVYEQSDTFADVYAEIADLTFRPRDWKQIVAVLWLGALCSLGWTCGRIIASRPRAGRRER